MSPDANRLIEQAIVTFERDLPELMREHAGKWVAYRGAERIGYAVTKDDLLQLCYGRGCADRELFVAKVRPDMPDECVLWEE